MNTNTSVDEFKPAIAVDNKNHHREKMLLLQKKTKK